MLEHRLSKCKTVPSTGSFHCVIASEYGLPFSKLSGGPFSSEKEIKFPLMMFQWPAMPDGCMKIRGNLVWLKKFHLKKMMFW